MDTDAAGRQPGRDQLQNIAQCLDRLTVQLFNAQDSTLALAKENGLLDIFVGLLSEVFQRVVAESEEDWRAPGVVDVNHSIIQNKLYFRMLGDVRMVLGHPLVSVYLLGERLDLLELFLTLLASMQVWHTLETLSIINPVQFRV